MEHVHLALLDKLRLVETIHVHLAILVAIIAQLPMELKYAPAAPSIMATMQTEPVHYVQLDRHLSEEIPHVLFVVLAVQIAQYLMEQPTRLA